MIQYKILVGDTDAPFEIRVPTIGVEAYLAPVTVNNTSGDEIGFEVELTVDQSDAAGYVGHLVNVIENTVGSSVRLLSDWRLNGVTVASINYAGGLACKAFASNGIDDKATETAITIDADGQVGIGTDTPLRSLHIAKAGSCEVIQQSTDAHATSNAVRWTVDTSANYELQFINAAISSGFAIWKIVRDAGAETVNNQRWYTNGAERMRVDTDGNVGVGNVPSGTYKLEVTGNVKSTGLTTGTVILETSNGLVRNVDNSATVIYGGLVDGATLVLYGPSATGNENDVLFRSDGGTDQLVYDHSASLWDFQANDIITTGGALFSATYNNQTGTTYTILASDNGKIITFDNAASIAVTLPDTLATNFQCTVVQVGAGVPTVTPNTDTINGAGTGVAPSAQWKGMYLSQYSATNWLALL